MEIKLTKDFRGKETKEEFYLAGSVVAVRDDYAERLIALGFAVEFDGGEGGVILPPPPVDPTLETKPMTVGKAAALVAHDNALIIENMKEDVSQVEIPKIIAEPMLAPKRGKKSKK